ncbi:MAG: hypothetical protein F6K22_02730 [Okeania sp. SIO2F4]|uniref:hypothetical protein n=1 Tax=Okeania sp. SIO2F4 TaxID=2607790 RepID=UPI00142AF90E|nr:hypothetical protein [Okeania sp. SIO2F4]NES01837.1 hypothetical protein [Okeania sp. SIO2F4]
MNFPGALSFLKKQTNLAFFLGAATNYKINLPLAIATNLVIGLSAIVPVAAQEIKPIESDTTDIIEILDEFQELFVQEERLPIENPELLQLDPTKLILAEDYDVRLYFINEGAAAKNQLGFTATNGVNSQESLAFDNISCHISNADCQLPSEDGV